MEHSFLAEHGAPRKFIALVEVAPAFAKRRVTGLVRTYHQGCVVQGDLGDYWTVGGEGAEFRRVVPGERSLLKFCFLIKKLSVDSVRFRKICGMRRANRLTCRRFSYCATAGRLLFRRHKPPNGDAVIS